MWQYPHLQAELAIILNSQTNHFMLPAKKGNMYCSDFENMYMAKKIGGSGSIVWSQ